MDDEKGFAVEERDDTWVVIDIEGNVFLDCGGQGNAEHYAGILNQAYRRGYKAGYRAAKRS